MKFAPNTTTTAFVAAFMVSGVVQASAQDQDSAPAQPGIVFELGLGGKVTPSYFGSSNLILSPVPLFRMKRLTLPNGFTLGGGREEGFSLSPAIDVISKRSTKDSPELAGLRTIDTAVELGVAAKYQTGHFRIMGEVRRGFGGHDGFRGELGADLIVRSGDQWTFHGGPRLNFADSTFTNTYFGVSAAEASARFPATTAGGGMMSAGLEAGVRYQMDEHWAIEAGAGWSRLTGDAAKSPITAQGSKNQYNLSFGVLRRFDIGF
ncbi:MAG: MipA/OmpV family protein [Hoeflea sp.]|uniref:MipA/OmpV family protein n=1 Tax=Hoeflea sp. TaxID=1940281 RepID=UPI00272F2C42|nr:MipA/OmpV family protein [Hoeflea sp.]MDP2122611.1 MipA/OmpV family protein [Hoeflea sp.]